VTSTTFGKRFSCAVDGAAYTQPLWVPALNVNGAFITSIFVATQHDSVYAFDAGCQSLPKAVASSLLPLRAKARPAKRLFQPRMLAMASRTSNRKLVSRVHR